MTKKSPIALVAVAALSLHALCAAGEVPSTSAASPAPTRGADASATLQEVTVTARRLELEKRVSAFVDHIADGENGAQALARWRTPPVCPLVSGLSRRDGEFILGRLSEIAAASGVPMAAKEDCQPNYYILITDQPEQLLRGMEKRNRAFTFGYDTSS